MGAGAALAQGSVAAADRDFIESRAFWEDPSGQVPFELATQQVYTPFKHMLNRGYSASVHWVRFTVDASPVPLVLRLLPPWLDDITLYDPAALAGPTTVGDRHPIARNAFHAPGHSLALPASAQPRTIWLRLQSTSTHLLSAEAITLERFTELNTSRLIWSALYAAVLILVFIILLFIWWAQRDGLLRIFLIKQAAYLYYSMAYLGLPTLFLSSWLSPAVLDQAFSWSVLLITPLVLRFDIALLSLYRPQRNLLALVKGIAWLSVGNLLLLLLLLAGHTSRAMEFNLLLLLAACLSVMLCALSCKPDPATQQIMSKRTMLLYYTLVLSSLPLGLITILGWAEPLEWTLYVLILHGLFTGVVMAIILFVRAHRLANLGQHMAWQLSKAQQDMALEKRRRQEQSQFMHMLMHELKTPLSVVALALGTRDNQQKNLTLASGAVRDMKAIIERCVQVDQVSELALERHSESVALGDVLHALGAAIPLLKDRLLARVEDLAPVTTDPQLLKIILGNLLDNAARYSDPVTPVQIQLQAAVQDGRAGVALRVLNTPGLAGWPDGERIFTKYYRSVGAQRDSGSGLGLFLAEQLASSLGGSLRYLPSQHQVEFALWLPQTPT